MPQPRSKHARIPHLELRPQGYVWRRRIPRSILHLDVVAKGPQPPGLVPDRVKPTQAMCVLRNANLPSDGIPYLHKNKCGIQTVVAGSSVCFPLKTYALPEAAALARKLSALSDQIFLYAATTMSLSLQDTRTLLTAFARFEIEADDRERALADPRSPQLAQAALEREAARQAVLRQAFFQHDYSVVREPLRHVANHLGIKLPDAASEQARLLAYEATRVMLDASQEKVRRDQGEFPGPSPYFSSVIAEQSNPGTNAQTPTTMTSIAPTNKEEAMKLFPRSWFASIKASPLQTEVLEEHAPAPSTPAQEEGLHALLRSRGVLQSCSPEVLAALKKGGAMEVSDGFLVYTALKSAGFGDEWQRHQKPDKAVGDKWQKSSLSSVRTASKIWAEEFRATEFTQASPDDIESTIEMIRRLSKYHGKGRKYTAKSYRALNAKVDKREAAAMDAAEREARRNGITNEAEIRDLRMAKAEPRLRVNTFVRLVRSVNRVGSMLKKLGVIEVNPFDICSFTNREEKALKATEALLEREPWDDRFDEFLASPVFQGKANGDADPLFWMPLIAALMGLRSEEAAQLGPMDVQWDSKVAYVIVRQELGDSVKSANATRKVPVHPALIELGFLELAERAKKDGQRRLFPSLKRGANKGTYTENFTKTFGYYRRTNDVYWHGLDFHALRTTFHHRLLDASCPGAHRRKLMGHEPLDEGEKSYAQKGISMPSLLKEVGKVPFDTARVRSPLGDYPKALHEGNGLRLVHRSAS